MTLKDRLLSICRKAIQDNKLGQEYTDRLELECVYLDAQNEIEYFLDLYDKGRRAKENRHNLLTPRLMGIVSDVDMSQTPDFEYGDFPDVDIDYLGPVRDYIKNEWAPKTFGAECVSNICTYNTFGIKNALINMARVYGKDRKEILDLTTKMGLKDDDNKALTWDKALELYPELKLYCDRNPEVAIAAAKLIGRNASLGKHAGGLIISNIPLSNFLPLVKDKDGLPTSSWGEGLHGQDLGPIGLLKFDALVITNLMQIALGCKFAKERHGLESICAFPGNSDWSDDSYLEDARALSLANRGELKCIFQFDSDGIRRMVKDGGVDGFKDLVAYTSLYRPSAMQLGMHDSYIKRKRGEEKYEIHPLLESAMRKTYNVLCYQETIALVLSLVGDIPLKDCETIRKAISKKKEKDFLKYKDMFITNGQKNLQWSQEKVEELWKQVEAFSGYGFNLSHAVAYSVISMRLLYLKAHFPLEFFAAILACEEDTEKVQEYRIEARRSGIKINPMDLNKSGGRFKIVGDEIYAGFANAKGIGDAVAEKISQGQPYNDFMDFITRFGTDATVVKPLVALRVFGEDKDPVELYKMCEHYKDKRNKRESRDKRYADSSKELLDELRSIAGEDCDFGIKSFDEHPRAEEIADILKKYRRKKSSYEEKAAGDKPLEDMFDFKPEAIEIKPELLEILQSVKESEQHFYGFSWRYEVEKSPDFEVGRSFEDHRASEGKSQDGKFLYVEGQILAVESKKSQKGTVYWLVKLQDAHGEVGQFQVWSDDWERWSEELVKDALVKVQLEPPSGGFRRYTLHAPPKWLRDRLLPKTKLTDYRIIKMRPSLPASQPVVLSHSESEHNDS